MPAGRLNSNDSEATGVQNARSRRHKPKGAAPESSQAPEPRRGRGNATGGAILSTKRAVPKATRRRAPLSKKPRRLAEVMPASRLNSNDSEATEVQNARSRRHKPKGAAPESSQAPEPRRGRGNATGGAILSTKRAVPKATRRRAPLSKKPRRLAEVMPASRLNSNDSEATEVQNARSRRHKPKGGGAGAAKPQSHVEVEGTPPGERDPQHQGGRDESYQTTKQHAARSTRRVCEVKPAGQLKAGTNVR